MIRNTALALGAALSLGACSTTASYTTDFDEQQDFSGYKTFAWADGKPMKVFGDARIPPGADTVITQEVLQELESKGYTFVKNEAKADFAVAFTVGSRTETDIIKTQVPTVYYSNTRNWRWGRPYYPAYPMGTTGVVGGREVTEVSTYTQGTLAIDIFDVERKAPVYHGAAEKTLSQNSRRGSGVVNPIEMQETIDEAVTKILEDFPPE